MQSSLFKEFYTYCIRIVIYFVHQMSLLDHIYSSMVKQTGHLLVIIPSGRNWAIWTLVWTKHLYNLGRLGQQF